MAAGALVPERCFAAGLNVAEGLDSVAQKNLEGAGGCSGKPVSTGTKCYLEGSP